ncbi:response regulator [Tichowtungia aerotolerans]|uniref:Response regulator n=1 Tax=Tichowtungia aerotolerans TaxID=2697043 RepID=A0A6P1M983_9BACT|nr:response regulator [Tichowtungia aerotolerans]QHI70592.1 response regulator [Tichowtungia aerotolerans]
MARILVVDDETGIITILKEMLLKLGYEVLTASGGNEALEKLSIGGVDLVVTDIVMPDIDGLELISNIQSMYPEIKIIAISGGGAQEGPETYLRDAKELGAARCLTKPFMLKELASMVQELLGEE